MAKIIYEVKQNQNSYSAAFGKWYAQIKNLETLNTRKLANHISEHGSIYTHSRRRLWRTREVPQLSR